MLLNERFLKRYTHLKHTQQSTNKANLKTFAIEMFNKNSLTTYYYLNLLNHLRT